jgi:preprotein translocase subunit SecF
VAILDQAYNPDATQGFDLNQRGADALAALLVALDPDGLGDQDPEARQAHYEAVAEAVAEARQSDGLLRDWEELRGLEGLSAESLEAIRANSRLGEFAVLGAENVGPQIGAELRQKGVLAVVLSLIGMLVYIWLRFELRFSIGALVATIHDVVVTLGLYALAGFEFNLTTIAAFLTLVGYSVNDTVVVFDRVRENMRRSRAQPLVEVMNLSLNQTLSRTILTSGTTLLAVGSLLFLGGEVLRGFAFIMTVGVIVGTYSTIYIAGLFTLLWEERFGRRARSEEAGAAAGTAANASTR